MIKGKTIVIVVGIVLGLFFILGIIGASVNTSIEQEVVNKPLPELLPTREDIGTEWVMGSESDNPFDKSLYQYKGGFGTYKINADETPILNATGYQESTVKKYSKANGSGGTIVVWPVIHRFNSTANALNHYTDIVNPLITAGGYQEYDTRGIDAKCYGTLHEGRLSDSLDFYCVKANIYYHVIGSNDQRFMVDGMKSVEEIAGIIAKKI